MTKGGGAAKSTRSVSTTSKSSSKEISGASASVASEPVDVNADDGNLPSVEEAIASLAEFGVPNWGADEDDGGVLAGLKCKSSRLQLRAFIWAALLLLYQIDLVALLSHITTTSPPPRFPCTCSVGLEEAQDSHRSTDRIYQIRESYERTTGCSVALHPRCRESPHEGFQGSQFQRRQGYNGAILGTE